MSGFEGLEFLSSMSAAQRAKLLDIAEDVEFAAGDRVLREGRESQALFIVSEGVLEVTMAATGDTPLTRIGPGAVVGEVSFALGRPASATVTAVERTMAFRIDAAVLDAQLASPEMASEFWRALARTLAARLVHRTNAWASVPRTGDAETTLPPELAEILGEFAGIVERLDAGDDVPDTEMDDYFARLSAALDKPLSDPDTGDATLAKVQESALPLMLLSSFGHRVWEKPRGYAGDWETIEMIYDNDRAGVGGVGIAVDGAFLRLPVSHAVRNRRGLLAKEIAKAANGGSASVTSLACGPAREIFDVMEETPDLLAAINLLDLDSTALAHVGHLATEAGLLDRTTLHEANLIKLALGREELALPPQDLVYSIGLIDYFPDDLVIALLNLIHGWLRPGGRAILGNFHSSNPSRPLMALFEWHLLHRSEEDMNRLYADSLFAKPCDEILWEDQHINLFAVGVRE